MSAPEDLGGGVTLHHGDCLDVLAALPAHCVDSVVTDPPYHLIARANAFGPGQFEKQKGKKAPSSCGFMGQQWDGGDVAFRAATWAAVLRVLKPGGHLLAFSGTRTYHRMAVAIEDAGFEIRDQFAWVYGSGFPKSHDVAKAIDKTLGAVREKVSVSAADLKNPPNLVGGAIRGDDRPWREAAMASGFHEIDGDTPATPEAAEWQGWGTAVKPAWEPLCLARAPLAESSVARNVLAHGTGALNIDACRVGTDGGTVTQHGDRESKTVHAYGDGLGARGGKIVSGDHGRWPANIAHDGSGDVTGLFPQTGKASGRDSMGRNHQAFTDDMRASLRDDVHPGHNDSGSAARFFKQSNYDEEELFLCAAKDIMSEWNRDHANNADDNFPPSREAVAFAVNHVQTGVGHDLSFQGHFTPATQKELRRICETVIATILSFGSSVWQEWQHGKRFRNGVLVRLAERQKQTGTTTIILSHWKSDGSAEDATLTITQQNAGHGGPAFQSRLFYTAKADAHDRRGSKHPTVKPLDLMAHYVRMITPPGGVVLDPFAGTGTTGEAALMQGFRAVLIEREAAHCDDIRRRVKTCMGTDANRRAVSSRKEPAPMPLFAGADE